MIQIIAGTALAAFVVGAAISYKVTSSYDHAQCDAEVNKARAAVAETAQKATESALLRERTANLQLNSLEVAHATVRQSLDQLTRDNRRLALELGGLRDPGTRRRVGAVPATATVQGEPEGEKDTSGRLSAEATEFLLDFAQRADDAASYARECRDWANIVTGEVAQDGQ